MDGAQDQIFLHYNVNFNSLLANTGLPVYWLGYSIIALQDILMPMLQAGWNCEEEHDHTALYIIVVCLKVTFTLTITKSYPLTK